MKATCNGKIVGALMNKVSFKDSQKNIDGFAEVLADDKGNFMWPILELVDKLYEVHDPLTDGHLSKVWRESDRKGWRGQFTLFLDNIKNSGGHF